MRNSNIGLLLMAALALSEVSCVAGILYSDVTYPLDTNLNNTPVGARTSRLDSKEVHDPFFTSIRIQWDSNAIGDIMKREGIARGYSADLNTFTILFGIWTQQHVRVNGEPAENK
ncbi:MAG: hypothetical protein ACKVS6_16755 [Planctomycetota bacterium]